ncbi:MAG: hypothetical protein HY959_08040 [Ignavibacteriae bacterium]|nr:hypothetical protein [Ignavibacteriota bacterium]
MKQIPFKTKKIVSLFFVIFTLFSSISYTQKNIDNESRWKLSVNGGLIYHIDKNIWARDYFKDVYEKGQKWSINYLEYNISYLLNDFHEIGLSIGKSDFTYPKRFIIGPSTSQGYPDTLITFSNINDLFALETINWYTLFYNFHYKKYFYFGIKLGGAYNAFRVFSIGKYIELRNPFYLKLEINYSFRSSDLFEFNKRKSEKISLVLGFGLNL